MKKATTVLLISLFFSLSLIGQTITFRIEKTYIDAGGILLAGTEYTAWSAVYDPATDELGDYSSQFAPFVSGNTLSPDALNIFDTMAADSAFSSNGGWTSLNAAAGPLAGTYDKSLERGSLTVGFAPILLITTAPTISGIDVGDYVGIVGSSVRATSLTTDVVDFTGTEFSTATWDTFTSLGASGSFELYQVAVPEPSTYAAIVGLLSLGFVMWRRRK